MTKKDQDTLDGLYKLLFERFEKWATDLKARITGTAGWLGDQINSKRIQALLANAPPQMKRLMSGLGTALPVLGNMLSAVEVITGRDWLSGERLTNGERLVSAIGMVPGAAALAKFGQMAKWKFFSEGATHTAAAVSQFATKLSNSAVAKGLDSKLAGTLKDGLTEVLPQLDVLRTYSVWSVSTIEEKTKPMLSQFFSGFVD